MPKKLSDNIYPVKALDLTNLIVFDKGKKGLEPIPMSDIALQKLITFVDRGDKQKDKFGNEYGSYLESLFAYENLINTGGLDKGSQIVGLLDKAGLECALTEAAAGFLKRRQKEFKRLMTPYKFEIPEQFQDANTVEAVSGPFIQDVYKQEADRYREKVTHFGFDDATKPFYLFPYQVDDVARLACKRAAFIGLEQGLGKTPISIAVAHMHGAKRVLVICPGPAVGSWKSGWRHEIHRMGVPKENIHVMREPEDLPSNYSDFPDNGRPHFFITDYGSLSRDTIAYHTFTCQCGATVDKSTKGICKDYGHRSWQHGSKSPDICPVCPIASRKKEDWTGNFCKVCGFKVRERINNVSRTKKGYTDPRPMWKRIKRGMFQTVFFDESQMIKNIGSKRSIAVQHLPGIKRRYIITGTMMTNYVQDTFWQLNLLFRGAFPINGKLMPYGSRKGHRENEEAFIRMFQYGSKVKDQLPSLCNRQSLWEMMSKVQVRRRCDDKDVDSQIHLPDLDLKTELIEMGKEHRLLYSLKTGTFKSDLRENLKKKGMDSGAISEVLNTLSMNEVEKQMEMLRMFACVPEIDPAYRDDLTTKDQRINQLVEEEIALGNKTVIFSSYRAFTEKMEEHYRDKGYEPMVLDGAVPTVKRWPMIDIWRTDPKVKVLIAGTRSMNYAVNFTSLNPAFDCRRVIFATPEWVPTNMSQAWKRVHRIGQTTDVEVYFIYHKDTVEHYMDDVIYAKRKLIAGAMDRVKDYSREDSVLVRSAAEVAKMVMGGANE